MTPSLPFLFFQKPEMMPVLTDIYAATDQILRRSFCLQIAGAPVIICCAAQVRGRYERP